MSTLPTQSPTLSTQPQRADTVELDRLEGGGLAIPVASDLNTEGTNGSKAFPRDVDGAFSQEIQSQAPTTSGHQNNESEESQGL
ncbi:hypothetical protein AAF712_010256 [Marasmius tenuissimus]|uniref:Uncharacterized protein n=1 Tax=Marasmius tenuissimus TaxID=585030 RepID=A0ABR2ZNG6_9AGAR